jgi:hypothetical protein
MLKIDYLFLVSSLFILFVIFGKLLKELSIENNALRLKIGEKASIYATEHFSINNTKQIENLIQHSFKLSNDSQSTHNALNSFYVSIALT